MNSQNPRQLRSIALALAALLLAWAAPAPGETFDEADIYFELNDTDGDLGLHAKIDGDAWLRLLLASPDGKEKMRVVTSGTMSSHGLTELFFESAEPSFDELPPARVFRRFKEGVWRITGTTIEGDVLASTDTVSHVLPAPAGHITISGVPAAASCDVEPLPVVAEPVIVDWHAVTTSHPTLGKAGPITVASYQFIAEFEHPEFGDLSFTVNLPPDVTEFEVPAEFVTLSGGELKFEIVVKEALGGNQTATESCFVVH
jgi:hypothetical protein